MKLNFTVDTDEIYEEKSFESLLTDALQKDIILKCKAGLASDEFNKFSSLVSETIIADIKLRMENFLSEEIVLTENWGKPTFFGSIEDLIKKQFDDILLRPVDSVGETLQGCTSSGNTWIEWTIKNKLETTLKNSIATARQGIEHYIDTLIRKKLVEIKDESLKAQVDSVFTDMLKK